MQWFSRTLPLLLKVGEVWWSYDCSVGGGKMCVLMHVRGCEIRATLLLGLCKATPSPQ